MAICIIIIHGRSLKWIKGTARLQCPALPALKLHAISKPNSLQVCHIVILLCYLLFNRLNPIVLLLDHDSLTGLDYLFPVKPSVEPDQVITKS